MLNLLKLFCSNVWCFVFLSGQTECIELLINAGVDPNEGVVYYDTTPLLYALCQRRYEVNVFKVVQLKFTDFVTNLRQRVIIYILHIKGKI